MISPYYIKNLKISNNIFYIKHKIKIILFYIKIILISLERYYSGSEMEMNIREEMKNLIKEYSFKNRKKLREMVKITWTDELNENSLS